ncbi:hypothetical protein DBZ36_15885 [Alginatibacterium sediminis]|uniref:Porin family protein n=1 Tax=Alginatibacterium sediminis TaxID=2164068 RepID=A0A420E8T5_9ALTE|nr:hypothetical protein [Alginatibacterium sediminis]RKF15850.1 hypothetical protein DBZ36_15885 [Alginatibacterium sediminis]
MHSNVLKLLPFSIIAALSWPVLASDDNLQDMSDPLAVYTQAGIGYTDKGINIKVGQTYDTGKDTTMGMNVLEAKGVLGESLAYRDHATDSFDSIRYRNFGVDLTNGRGSQIDVNYSFASEMGTASYSLIQALPKLGPVQLYPLAGLGVSFGNNIDQTLSENGITGTDFGSGYSIPGTFAVVGMYSKIEVTDKIWLNYNPMWLTTLSGDSVWYKDQYFAGSSNILTHEIAASYQINPRTNVRYFANFSQDVAFDRGEHRVEVNYQF